jgi:Protein tyrosine and serine/threonine kinase
MWEMIARQQPWDLMKNDEVQAALIRGERLPKPEAVPGDRIDEDIIEEFYLLMQKCWVTPAADGRLHFSQIRATLEELDRCHHVPRTPESAQSGSGGLYVHTPGVADSVAAQYYAMRYAQNSDAYASSLN